MEVCFYGCAEILRHSPPCQCCLHLNPVLPPPPGGVLAVQKGYLLPRLPFSSSLPALACAANQEICRLKGLQLREFPWQQPPPRRSLLPAQTLISESGCCCFSQRFTTEEEGERIGGEEREVDSWQKGEKELITESHSSHKSGGYSFGISFNLGCAHILLCRLDYTSDVLASHERRQGELIPLAGWTYPIYLRISWRPEITALPPMKGVGHKTYNGRELFRPQPRWLFSQLAYSALSLPRCLCGFWFWEEPENCWRGGGEGGGRKVNQASTSLWFWLMAAKNELSTIWAVEWGLGLFQRLGIMPFTLCRKPLLAFRPLHGIIATLLFDRHHAIESVLLQAWFAFELWFNF